MNPNNTRTKNLPDQIADLFLALIFMGDLKAGDRLPPELQLTKILKVNQSSLRMAMRILVRMNVIKSTRGSGLLVLDYKKNAGLNFIADLLNIPELELGSEILLEVLENAPFILTELTKSVIQDQSFSDYMPYIHLFDKQIELFENNACPMNVVELDIAAQNYASSMLNNLILQTAFNSFMPLRNYMMHLYYSIAPDNLARIKKQKALWLALSTKQINKKQFINNYFEFISEETHILKKHLASLPQEPHLKKSPLKHYPELITLQA